MTNETEPTAQARLETLSTRQLECLSLVGIGMTTKEIARALDLSPLTVDKYLSSALRTLGVRSRMEAASLVSQFHPKDISVSEAVQLQPIAASAPSLIDEAIKESVSLEREKITEMLRHQERFDRRLTLILKIAVALTVVNAIGAVVSTVNLIWDIPLAN